MKALFLILFTCCLLSTPCIAEQKNPQVIELIKLNNFANPQENIYTSGQPTQAQLSQLADKGVKHIINLRGKNETQWDEEDVVNTLGLQYAALPITSKADINVTNAILLQKLLNETSSEATLVHCASSNRVGALVAVYHATELKLPIEQAIAIGKQWGLKSLESVVTDEVTRYQNTLIQK
ncbi:hypothetical protein HH219_08870 [Pseudoalteromonas sp. NEC-BIFX-2020_015]|uniref:fused DSP-PTPase phosphatase/NAD kinase-like protein n=1 Tax=Pseudoalteromonas sp. NEC-BIFX-2020_015 TaxID=2729544 RepID=UPI0014616113|nr:sulfur transferase domain-containing protein [Pseudoalteromonas sp. NEC-BIFX-2020_015]NMR25636.1 hypothetical protein [Pseudoalteromonas sp. NEC-BIFX-2020_015]